MATEATLDKVSIEIEAGTKKAVEELNSLSNSLSNLKKSISGGFNGIKKLSENLKELKESSNGFSETANNLKALGDLSESLSKLSNIKPLRKNVTNGLNNLIQTSNSIPQMLTNLSDIDSVVEPLQKFSEIQAPTGLSSLTRNLGTLLSFDKSDLEELPIVFEKLKTAIPDMSKFSEIPNPKGFSALTKNLEKLFDNFNKLDDPSALENLGRVASEVADKLQPLAERMANIAQGFHAISQMASTYGVGITKIHDYTKQTIPLTQTLHKWVSALRQPFKTLATNGVNSLNNLSKGFERLTQRTKKFVLTFLGTRTVFTLIHKAYSEYAAFDQSFKDSAQNLWRALGAQLLPILELVLKAFTQVVRVVYSFVYAITGIDLIARANARALASQNKSAKSLLGTLQKFDDLNVVTFSSDSETDQIDLDKIDLTPFQSLINWVKEFKQSISDALDTGEWYNVGLVFANGVNQGVDYLLNKLDSVREKVLKIASNLADMLNGYIENVEWSKVGTLVGESIKLALSGAYTFFTKLDWGKIGESITNFFEGLDVADIVDKLSKVVSSIVVGISEALKNINWKSFAEGLSETVKVFINNIVEGLKKIDFKELGENIRTVILNIDWKGIGDSIVKLVSGIIEGLSELLQGLFNIDEDKSYNLMGAFLALGLIFGVMKGISGIKKSVTEGITDLSTGFKTLFESIGKATEIIAILGGLSLVLYSFNELLKTITESGMSWKEFGIILAESIGGVAAGFGLLALETKLLDDKKLLMTLVIFAGFVGVILSLNKLINTLNSLGDNSNTVFAELGGILIGLEILLWTIVAAAKVLGSDPLCMLAVIVVVGAIVILLKRLSETLPIILSAVDRFINNVVPVLSKALDNIFKHIEIIVYILGTTLIRVVQEVGNVIDKIFNGISKVIDTVGRNITGIMTTAKNCTIDVLKAIITFINDLGPAINNFVDNAIKAVTKLINFIVSAVEYLINIVIVNPINALISNIKKMTDFISWLGFDIKLSKISKVSIERFAPKLQTGTNEIPQEGLYHLHPGEAVVPKKYNPALGNGDNEETNNKLETLINLVRTMDTTTVVNVGNKELYREQRNFNKREQNKFGTLNLY